LKTENISRAVPLTAYKNRGEQMNKKLSNLYDTLKFSNYETALVIVKNLIYDSRLFAKKKLNSNRESVKFFVNAGKLKELLFGGIKGHFSQNLNEFVVDRDVVDVNFSSKHLNMLQHESNFLKHLEIINKYNTIAETRLQFPNYVNNEFRLKEINRVAKRKIFSLITNRLDAEILNLEVRYMNAQDSPQRALIGTQLNLLQKLSPKIFITNVDKFYENFLEIKSLKHQNNNSRTDVKHFISWLRENNFSESKILDNYQKELLDSRLLKLCQDFHMIEREVVQQSSQLFENTDKASKILSDSFFNAQLKVFNYLFTLQDIPLFSNTTDRSSFSLIFFKLRALLERTNFEIFFSNDKNNNNGSIVQTNLLKQEFQKEIVDIRNTLVNIIISKEIPENILLNSSANFRYSVDLKLRLCFIFNFYVNQMLLDLFRLRNYSKFPDEFRSVFILRNTFDPLFNKTLLNESLAKLVFLKIQQGESLDLLTLSFLDSSEYVNQSIFSNSFFGRAINDLHLKNMTLASQFNKHLSTFFQRYNDLLDAKKNMPVLSLSVDELFNDLQENLYLEPTLSEIDFSVVKNEMSSNFENWFEYELDSFTNLISTVEMEKLILKNNNERLKEKSFNFVFESLKLDLFQLFGHLHFRSNSDDIKYMKNIISGILSKLNWLKASDVIQEDIFLNFYTKFIKVSNQLLNNIELSKINGDIVALDMRFLNFKLEELFIEFSNFEKHSGVSLDFMDILFRKTNNSALDDFNSKFFFNFYMSFYRSNLNFFNKLDFLQFLLKRVKQLDIFYNSKYNIGSKLFYDLNNLDRLSFHKYVSRSIVDFFFDKR